MHTTLDDKVQPPDPKTLDTFLRNYARKLHENDPLPGKYVNTREAELFTKGAIVYGLDKARDAIAKEDRACVVEERTPLRKSGGRLMGRCPFHDERTASFSVSPAKGMYYCFGCGKGGDVFTFVEDSQGLDFTSTVE